MYLRSQVYSSRTEASRLGEQRSSTKTRAYTMRLRQESIEQTRLRITEATMRLHESVGPAGTTVSAIADKAGVTRLTVYRHFPDDADLIGACSALWRELHPSPRPEEWAAIRDPVQRLRVALGETYFWARTAAPMMSKIYRDLDTLPAFVSESLAEDASRRVATLARGFGARGRSAVRLRGALRHALHISTWESLCVGSRLEEQDAIDLMLGAVVAAVDTTRGPVRGT
jgi:AcrR family transcriptional regulator